MDELKERIDYQENLEAALFDVLDGNSGWREIRANTGVSEERAKEIEKFFDDFSPKYLKKHGII